MDRSMLRRRGGAGWALFIGVMLALGHLESDALTSGHVLWGQAETDLRAAIPPFAKQQDAAKLLEETQGLKALDTAAKKKAAVKKLMELAQDDGLASEELYVVLTKTLVLAKEVDDLTSLNEALNQLTTSFAVDRLKEQSQAWVAYLESCNSKTSFKTAADFVADIARDAVKEDRFTEAIAVLKAAEAAATRLDVNASQKQVLTKQLVQVAARETLWKSFREAEKQLEKNPQDSASSLIVGQWYAFEENNWTRAIPLLSHVKDAKWKAAAEKELAAWSDASKMQDAADGWWELAATEPAATKTKLQLHAGDLYEKALASIASPLKKQQLAAKIAEIDALRPASGSTMMKGTNAFRQPKALSKPGEWVDLLAWTEGVDWSKKGVDWNNNLERSPSKNGVALKPAPFNRYPLPAIINGDYELDVEFTRTFGNEGIAVFFPVGMHNLQFEVSTGGRGAFLAFVNGARYMDRIDGAIANHEKQRITIRVQSDGEKASIKIDWNDQKDYITWEGPEWALANRIESDQWKLSTTRHVWLGSFKNVLTYSRARIRMLSGEVLRDSITEEDRQNDLKNGLVRLVGETPNNPKVGWARFCINQLPFDVGPGDEERLWPLVTPEPSICQDFYGAHAPSRLKCPIPKSARSFSVYGSNDGSRTTRFQVFVDGKELYTSGMTDLVLIKLDLPPDASLLELVVDDMGNRHFDHSYWCWPRYHSVTVDKLTDKMLEGKLSSTGLKFTIASAAVGARKLTHNAPIQFLTAVPLQPEDQKPCDEFLYGHASSTVSFAVPDGMTRFTAVGYAMRSQHVRFEVWADAKRIYVSPQAGIIPMDVKLPRGTKTIELKASDMGNGDSDHTMWCYPRLHRK